MLAKPVRLVFLLICSRCAAQTPPPVARPAAGDRPTGKEIQLLIALSERNEAEASARNAQSAYEELVKALEDGGDGGLDRFVMKRTPYLAQHQAAVLILQDNLEELKSRYGEENPQYKAAAASLARKRKSYEEAVAAARAQAKVVALDTLKKEADQAKSKAQSLRAHVERLTKEVSEESARAPAEQVPPRVTPPQNRAQVLAALRVNIETRVNDLDVEMRELEFKISRARKEQTRLRDQLQSVEAQLNRTKKAEE